MKFFDYKKDKDMCAKYICLNLDLKGFYGFHGLAKIVSN
jgi:hypothetical protein